MKKEYDFTNAKRASFRGLPPEKERARHTKVRITILLDQDVLRFFKLRAAKRGAEPYQTQINRALRQYMSEGRSPLKDDLLNDEEFISRLSERMGKCSTGRRARSRRVSKTKARELPHVGKR